MLRFNENKVTTNIFKPITLIFILFMPNYFSFLSETPGTRYKLYELKNW
jgi:hypothetical protein